MVVMSLGKAWRLEFHEERRGRVWARDDLSAGRFLHYQYDVNVLNDLTMESKTPWLIIKSKGSSGTVDILRKRIRHDPQRA